MNNPVHKAIYYVRHEYSVPAPAVKQELEILQATVARNMRDLGLDPTLNDAYEITARNGEIVMSFTTVDEDDDV